MTALTAVSTFSAGGGLDLGAGMAGFVTRVAVEWEAHACDTLRSVRALGRVMPDGHQHLRDCEIVQADIHDVTDGELLRVARLARGECDLFMGGPPCVTFSVAGRRAGTADETGLLFREYVRLLHAVRPRVFLYENVKGLLSAPGIEGASGGAFDEVLDALAATGYSLAWRVLDAANYGVPQRRERLIVTGWRDRPNPGLPDPTHRDPRAPAGDPDRLAAWRTVRDAIGHLPAAAAAGQSPLAPNHVMRAHSPDVVARIRDLQPGQRLRSLARARLHWDRPGHTVRAQGKPKRDGSGGLNGSHPHIHPSEHRQLTPREQAALQSFPDWYPLPRAATHAYRVAGDAVPPVFARALCAHIAQHLR